MCKITLNSLLAVTAFISFSISPTNCSGMMDYLVHIMTTSDISFAHLSGGQPLPEGRWTKEHRCAPGSYVTDYGWLVSPEGTLLAIVAWCREAKTAKYTNLIDISTRRYIGTGEFTRYAAPEGKYARGFVVQTWTDSSGTRENIGERKFIFKKNVNRTCPEGTINCITRQYLCAPGLNVCSLQVKVHGGDGIEGGSITQLRFRCCYACQHQLEFMETLLWSSSKNDRTFHYANGTYGVRILKLSTGGRARRPNKETEIEEYDYVANANLISEEVAYEDYSYETGDQGDGETPVDIPVSTLSHNGSRYVTWESVVQTIFNSAIKHPNGDNDCSNITANASEAVKRGTHFLARARRALNRRFSKRSTSSSKQAMVFESTEDDAVKKILREQYRKNGYRIKQSLATSRKMDVKYNKTFVCELGFLCEVWLKTTRCDRHMFIDPATLIKRKVVPSFTMQLKSYTNSKQQNYHELWINVPDVVRVTPLLLASNTTWEEKAVCPNGSFVVDHQQSRPILDSATVHKGILLACASAEGRDLKLVTSAIGAQKKWGQTVAKLTSIATGYRFRKKPGASGYFYELLRATAPDARNDNISRGPTSAREFYCPKNWAVCGFRLSKPDSAEALRTSVEFKCCYHSFLEERFQTTSHPQNPVLHPAADHLRIQNIPSDKAARSLNDAASLLQAAELANLEFILSYGQTGRQSEYPCPADSVATSIRTKSEQGLGMTGFEMQCSRPTTHRENNTTSEEYIKSQLLTAEVSTVSGKWDSETRETGKPVTGFYIDWNRDKELEGFTVSYGPIFGPEDDNVRTQNEVLFCPPHHKVCGFDYTADKANDHCTTEAQMLHSRAKHRHIAGKWSSIRQSELLVTCGPFEGLTAFFRGNGKHSYS